jgi:hypothetical protein
MKFRQKTTPTIFGFGLISIFGLIAPGCLYDEDKPCGDDYVTGPFGTCVCPEGTAPGAEGGCEEVPAGTGGTDGAGGTDPGLGGLGGEPSSSGGADDGGGDDLMQEPCTSDAECAAMEDGYCDMFQGFCTKQNCSVENDECPSEWECCDFEDFGLPKICVSIELGGCPV